jgi:NADPH-dependent curcumin reductase CurA
VTTGEGAVVQAQCVQVVRYPETNVRDDDFEIVTHPLGPLADGQVLVRNTWTSVDPALRIRLRPNAPAGYFAAFPLGQPMDAIMTIGEVMESRADGFNVGDTVWHGAGWRSHAIIDAGQVAMNGLATLRVLDASRVPAQSYLGPLGTMGLTAYAGLRLLGALERPGTLWVSGAAGAVGSLVCQMGVQLGLRVVASAGSDDKVAWLRDEVGVAAAFNRREANLVQSLREAAPEGLDFYFDGVGADHLEAALECMNQGGAIALCGAIAEYEQDQPGLRNLFLATSKNLTLRGFRASSHADWIEPMQDLLGGWLAEGLISYPESIFEGLSRAPQALADMMAGRTVGKTLVQI